VGEVTYQQGRIERYVALAEGFVEVADDVVTVLTESAELPEEIDVDAARREATEAEKAVNEAVDEGWVQAQVRLERALSRITVAQKVPLREIHPRD
jgi:F-type H+-transporting ATPase subunit epsilon